MRSHDDARVLDEVVIFQSYLQPLFIRVRGSEKRRLVGQLSLFFKHVKRGAGERAVLERINERLRLDDRTAGSVDEV